MDVIVRADPDWARHSARIKPYIVAAYRTFIFVINAYNFVIPHIVDAVIMETLHFFNAENCKITFFSNRCVYNFITDMVQNESIRA
jgi:hypothetical protein